MAIRSFRVQRPDVRRGLASVALFAVARSKVIRKAPLTLFMFCLLVCPSADAAASHVYFSGTQLWSMKLMCEAGSGTACGFYQGFVTGVADSANGVNFCIPTFVTRDVVISVVTKYLAKPENKQWSAFSSVAAALGEQFRCPHWANPAAQ